MVVTSFSLSLRSSQVVFSYCTAGKENVIKNLLCRRKRATFVFPFWAHTQCSISDWRLFFVGLAILPCIEHHIFSSGSMVRAVILMSCMLLLYFQLLSKFYNLECTRRQSIPTGDIGSNCGAHTNSTHRSFALSSFERGRLGCQRKAEQRNRREDKTKDRMV